MHPGMCVYVRGQLLGVSLGFAPCGSWHLNSGLQAREQAPLPAESYCQPLHQLYSKCLLAESSCRPPLFFLIKALLYTPGWL